MEADVHADRWSDSLQGARPPEAIRPSAWRESPHPTPRMAEPWPAATLRFSTSLPLVKRPSVLP